LSVRTCQFCGEFQDHTRNFCTKCSSVVDTIVMNIAPSAMPSTKNHVPPRKPNNSWEKGIRKDNRGVPYLDKTGQEVRMGEKFNKYDYKPKPINVTKK